MNPATFSLTLGTAAVALSLPFLIWPLVFRSLLDRLPRSRIAAWILTAIALLWSTWLLYRMPMGRFEPLKDYLWFITPAVFAATVWLMDDLLAARAFGGILALIPAPLLNVARWHESSWRFAIILPAYVLAIVGMGLILSPYRFRLVVRRIPPSPAACRAIGSVLASLGILWIVLAISAFQTPPAH